MTQEDKDAIYGRAKREEREARQQLAFMQKEVERVCDVLGRFSNTFRHNSHLVNVEADEFVIASPIDTRTRLERYKMADFDGQKIKNLIRELEETRTRLQKAETEARALEG